MTWPSTTSTRTSTALVELGRLQQQGAALMGSQHLGLSFSQQQEQQQEKLLCKLC